MSSVVNLAERDPRNGPWLQGPAHCIVCAHRWHQVVKAGVGSQLLECPKCLRDSGVVSGFVAPKDGIPRLACSECGYQLWRVLPESLLCAVCGVSRELPA